MKFKYIVMSFSQSFLIILVLLFPLSKVEDKSKASNVKDTFVKWNKATLESLRYHKHLAKNTARSHIYQNRLVALKAYLEIDTDNKVNVNSIRYQFLNEIFSKNKEKRNFYVIEANHSGESVELKNYVIYPDGDMLFKVEIYYYNETKWVKKSGSERVNCTSKPNLRRVTTKFGTGFNLDDVIVTEFANKSVKFSDYHLYGTLNNESLLRKILSLN